VHCNRQYSNFKIVKYLLQTEIQVVIIIMSAQNKSGEWLKLTNQLKHTDTNVQACNPYEEVRV